MAKDFLECWEFLGVDLFDLRKEQGVLGIERQKEEGG